MTESIEMTAYREAGHAVMCVLVGDRRVIDVTIKSSGNKLGETKYEPRHWVSDHRRDEIRNIEVWAELLKDAMIGYAGEQAQILRFGHPEATPDTNCDYMVFLLILCDDIERDQVILDVETLLEDNWDKVQAVAEALLERITLSGQEVEEIIGK